MCAEPQAETKRNCRLVQTHFSVAVRSEVSFIYAPAVWFCKINIRNGKRFIHLAEQ
jgi:hypothetical protein